MPAVPPPRPVPVPAPAATAGVSEVPAAWALLVPARADEPCRLVRVPLRAVAISDEIGGGVLDDTACEHPVAAAHTIYQDADRDALGLPDNPRALRLDMRLAWPHLPDRLSLRGEVLVLGLDACGQDTHVPADVLVAAVQERLLPGAPGSASTRRGAGWPRGHDAGVSRAPGSPRTVTVPAQRLVRWVRGFAERHGDLAATATADGFDLEAADGSTARVSASSAPVPLPPGEQPGGDGHADPIALATAVAGHLLAEREIALLLVRRGGYAVARLHGADVVAVKVGSRYVQGRTAAGGWSQQRFARRRENQAAALVTAVVEVALRLLVTGAPGPVADALVTGGDRALVERALGDPRLHALAGLPRGPHLPVGDPRAATVREVASGLRSARVTITDPAGT